MGLPDRQAGDFRDVLGVDLDGQGLGLQARALAHLARRLRLIARQVLAHPGRIGLAPAPVHIGNDAFERLGDVVAARAVLIGELDLFRAGSVQQDVVDGVGQGGPLGVHLEAVVQGQALQRLGVQRRGAFRPRRNGPAGQGLLRIGNDQVLVEGQLDAQTVAGRTGAERIIERKQPGLDLGNGEAGHGAGELFREQDALRLGLALGNIGEFGDRQSIGQAQRRLQAVGQARHDPALDHDAVNDDVDIVLEVLFQLGRILDGVIGAVDLQPLKTLLLQFGDFLAVLALAASDMGRQQQQARAFGQHHDPVDHLRNGLRFDGQAGRRRIGNADARPQQAHIVVDFGDRADGRARVLRGRLLLDRNRR